MPKNKVAICSLFRNNVHDVLRTFQDRARWFFDRQHILHICIEGDSTDKTFETLQSVRGFRVVAQKLDCNIPHYGSIAEPTRLRSLAKSWNMAFDIAVAEKAHYIMLLDSDITTPPTLLPRLLSHHKAVVAPMLFFEKSIFFRDSWAYHAGNVDFLNRHPYHTHYRNNQLFEVDGVGLPFMRYDVLARGARCDDHEVRGLCKAIKALDYPIFVDPELATYHPRCGIAIPPNHER